MRLTVTLLLSSLLLAAGCSTTSGPGGAVTETAANVLISVEEENRMGDQMAAEIAKEHTLLQDPEVTGYVKDLGQRVASQAEETPEGIEYTFHVIDEDVVNAFAIPGGHIYVYTGLLRAMEDEAELTAVLSHEVAHVAERHVAERLVAAYGLQALQQLAFGENPGLLGELVAGIGGQGYLLKHSRDAERQADRVGLRYQVAAGYDPNGFVDFFQRLEGQGGGACRCSCRPTPTPSSGSRTSARRWPRWASCPRRPIRRSTSACWRSWPRPAASLDISRADRLSRSEAVKSSAESAKTAEIEDESRMHGQDHMSWSGLSAFSAISAISALRMSDLSEPKRSLVKDPG